MSQKFEIEQKSANGVKMAVTSILKLQLLYIIKLN